MIVLKGSHCEIVVSLLIMIVFKGSVSKIVMSLSFFLHNVMFGIVCFSFLASLFKSNCSFNQSILCQKYFWPDFKY